jgi:hypothetical protein
MTPSRSPPNPSTLWYREPYVWLLISIPAAAVLAALITLALAIPSDDTPRRCAGARRHVIARDRLSAFRAAGSGWWQLRGYHTAVSH